MQDDHAIKELLNAKEGEQVQFKEAKNRFDSSEAARICCALSNCGGGKLVFGISDKRPRQVVGSDAFDQPERTRKGLIDKLKVMVDFQLYEYNGKRVLVFDVPRDHWGFLYRQMGLHGGMKVTVLFRCRKMCGAKFMKKQEWISRAQSVLTPNSVILMKTPLKYSEKNG